MVVYEIDKLIYLPISSIELHKSDLSSHHLLISYLVQLVCLSACTHSSLSSLEGLGCTFFERPLSFLDQATSFPRKYLSGPKS